MSSTPPPTGDHGRWLSVVTLTLWGGCTLLSYAISRDSDLQPVFSSLLARVADLAVPLGLLTLHLPAAEWLSRLLFGVNRQRDLVTLASLSLCSIMGTGVVLGALQLLHPAAILALPTSVALARWRRLPELVRLIKRESGHLLRRFRYGPGLASGVLLLVALGVSLTPATSQDALHYHLAVPAIWWKAGYFCDVPGNVYSHFPMNVEVLYLSALALRGELAAKVFHWLLGVLSCLVIWRLAARFAGQRAAALAPLLFLAIPSVFRVLGWAYVEMGLILFLLLAWEQFLELSSDRRARAWALGFYLGVACGTKYTALPVALLLLLFALRFAPKGLALRTLLGTVGAAIAGGGFWYARNLVMTGNPMFPFLFSLFGGVGWDAERAHAFRRSLEEWGTEGWRLPLDLVLNASFSSVEGFDGVVGPILLLGVPFVGLAIWRRPAVRSSALLAIGLCFLWWMTTHQVRFLLPALAVGSILVAVGWDCLPRRQGRRLAMVILVGGVCSTLPSHLMILAHERPLAYAIGLESERDHRQRCLGGGDAELFSQLDEVLPANARVLFAASGNPGFLCPRDYHADSVVENYTLRGMLAHGGAPGIARALHAEGFSHLLFRFEMVFGAPGVRTDLSLAEQHRLSELLNRYGRLVLRVGTTMLYEVSPPGGVPR